MRRAEHKSRVRRSTVCWSGSLLAALALDLAARLFPAFAEWYAEKIYPIWVGSLGRVSALVPVSLIELLIYAAILSALAGLLLVIRRRLRLRRLAAIVVKFAIVLFVLFTLNCGINYQRRTFAERAGFTLEKSTENELAELCEALVQEINEAAAELETESPEGLSDSRDLGTEAVKAMQRAGESYPELAGYYPVPKQIFSWWYMSYQQLQGEYSPFTIEVNYNGDMPQPDKPSTVCHELSHLKGFMREDEANFIAYLACRASDSAAFRYSGALLAYIYSGNALYRENPERMIAIRKKLCARAEADLAEHNRYWKSFAGKVADISDKMNDTYLRANSQKGGVKSYGRMVDLLLAERRRKTDE